MPFTEETVRDLAILTKIDAPQEKVITCFYGREIYCGRFHSTHYEGEVITLAVSSFAHLIRGETASGTTRSYTFSEVADLIERSYDMDEARNAETVRVLRRVHRLNLQQMGGKDGQAVAPY